AVAAMIGWRLSGPYPYWAALTVITCARAEEKTSLVIALQNVIATLLGAVLADLLIASVQSSLVIGLIVVAVTFLAFTVKESNYMLHLFFLTNLILLVISIGTAGHAFVVWRVLAILIGAGIVLVITLLNQDLLVKNEPLPGVS
ncbi:MAG TPA: FUSC family protein, partial [Ktedonobacteraceae bacterium]|nr:FUSC family protein [Ktedonobacteraceae bacterium]